MPKLAAVGWKKDKSGSNVLAIIIHLAIDFAAPNILILTV
jgi:hypothetical protein